MKTLFALLCLCFSANAQLALNNAFYNTFLNRNSGVNYGYFMREDFEAPGYENVWTQAGSGTINDTCTSAPCPLLGSDSLRLAMSGDTRRTTNAFASGHSTVYGFFMIYFQNRPALREVVGIWNDGTQLLSIGIDNVGNQLYFDDGTITQSTGGVVNNNTLYYVWFRYTKGSGANAQYEIAFSEDIGSKPVSGIFYKANSSGVSTLDANRFVIGTTTGAATWTAVFDKIRLSTSDIGSNPE